VEIEFDSVKNQINLLKHGVSLAAAADIDLGRAVVIEDRRFEYGETRFYRLRASRRPVACPVVHEAG
jgi:uncharacterized protein